MHEPIDGFERRLGEMVRLYMAESIPTTDTAAAGRVSNRKSRWVLGFSGIAGALVTMGGAALIVGAIVTRPTALGPDPTHSSRTPFGTSMGSPAAPTSSCSLVGQGESSPSTSLSAADERESSDRYWGFVTRFKPGGYGYQTIEQITEGSHLVVVGRVIGRSSGESTDCRLSAGYAAFGVVAIDEVLKGEARSIVPGTVVVAGLASEAVDDANLPRGQVVLFLKNYAQMRTDEGAPPVGDPDESLRYFLPNRYQTVLRDLDGVVDIIDAPAGWWSQYGPFPSDVEHQPFASVVDRIRQIGEQ